MLIHETLENGIEVAVKENHFSQTLSIQIWVGVGSLHEGMDEQGMAHFLEHMLFKGTSHRRSEEIGGAIEASGGEINAYTTFDHTVLHLSIPSTGLETGLEILSDVTFHSIFDEEEFTREREVILEEIKRSADNPGAKIGHKVFELAFAGTPAQRPIFGSMESVSKFCRQDLVSFHKKWYRPDNIKIVVVGAVDAGRVYEAVSRTFGTFKSFSSDQTPLPRLQVKRVLPTKDIPQIALIRGDWKKPRLEISFPVPALEHPDIPALDLAAFALGSGDLSRLSRRARDQEGVVTAVSASVYAPSFGGLFEISAFTTEDAILEALEVLARELVKLVNVEPIYEDELERARANLKADRIYRDETVEGQARSLGFSLRTAYPLVYDEIYTAHINALPNTQIRSALARWLKPSQAIIVAMIPEDSKLVESDFLESYQKGILAGQNWKPQKVAHRAKQSDVVSTQEKAHVFHVNDGLRLVYRSDPKLQLFTLTLASEGGLRAETDNNAGSYYAFAAMLAAATKRHSFTELLGRVESFGATMEGFSGKDSFGFHLQCLPEHADAMLGLLGECLLEPVFPEEQWAAVARELAQSIQTQDDSPASVCMRRFQELVYGKHPYRFPLYGLKSSVANFSAESLQRFYLEVRDAGPWVCAAAGPFPEEDLFERLKKSFVAWNPNSKRRAFLNDGRIQTELLKSQVKISKKREQAHILYGFQGISWSDPDRAALDVLMNILGGHGGRLFRKLRDQESLAYTVSPILSYGKDPGVVGSYIACSPAKIDQAISGLQKEMLHFVNEVPLEAEITRARNFIMGSHKMGLQRSDAQVNSMALMELYGLGFDDFLKYPTKVEDVTVQDVQKVAQRLFLIDHDVLVVVGPDMLIQESNAVS